MLRRSKEFPFDIIKLCLSDKKIDDYPNLRKSIVELFFPFFSHKMNL